MTGRPIPSRGLFTATHAITGKLVSFAADVPDLAAGDAEFLDAARPFELQIRPVLSAERTPGAIGDYPPGAHWLIFKSATGKQLRAIVKLPFSHSRNTRSNAMRAVRQVERYDLRYGALFRLVSRGVDPFTDDFAVIVAV
jgi:hypothetical protein